MTLDLLKSYWKYRYKTVIVWLAFFLLTFWLNPTNPFGDVVFVLIIGSSELYRFKETAEKIRKLKTKGLTEQDLINIEFVKKWERDHATGIWVYCLKYGLIIGAFGFSLAVSLLYGIIYTAKFKLILSDPGSMFHFIGIAYIIGAFLGVIFFRISWHFNERHFMRLTDPLNVIFNSKRVSFYGHL